MLEDWNNYVKDDNEGEEGKVVSGKIFGLSLEWIQRFFLYAPDIKLPIILIETVGFRILIFWITRYLDCLGSIINYKSPVGTIL